MSTIIPLHGGNVFLDDAIVALLDANPEATAVLLVFRNGETEVGRFECPAVANGYRRTARSVAGSVVNRATTMPSWDQVELSAVGDGESK